MQDRKKPTGKTVIVKLNSNFAKIVTDVMDDERFYFDNFLLFVELACYELCLNFNDIKNDPPKLEKFIEKLKSERETLVRKNQINKTMYGLKAT